MSQSFTSREEASTFKKFWKLPGRVIAVGDEEPVKAAPLAVEKLVTVTKNKPVSKSKPVESLPLPGIPKKRGRPSTGKALSNAERQRVFRSSRKRLEQYRLESAAQSFENETDEELYSWLATSGPTLQEKAWIELGRRKGWKMSLL